MTFLEFIRKNLLIAVIVIVGILVGLIMMDYGDSGGAFSREYRVEINGTRHKAQDIVNLGAKTEHYLYRIQNTLLLQAWSIGVLEHHEENLAVNRLLLREAAKELGIVPSNEQIDEYIKTLPVFNVNGSFNTEAYKEVVGYRNGQIDSVGQKDFRELISDIIIWETIQAIVTANVTNNAEAQAKIDQAMNQNISGFTAKLQLAAQEEPAAPTAEQLKPYWELHKDDYKTAEKRSFTIIKLTDVNENGNITDTARQIQETLVKAPGADPEAVITAKLAELGPETAATVEYEIRPYAECSADSVPEELKQYKVAAGNGLTLGELVFNTELTAQTAGQYSQYYPVTGDREAYIIRTDSIIPATTQSFEQAEEAARKDWIANERVSRLYEKADSVHKAISEALAAGQDMKSAFEAAKAAGATVEEFTNANIAAQASDEEQLSALRRTHTGSLAPVVQSPTEAIITGISSRTINPEAQVIPQELHNMLLQWEIMNDWLRTAYSRYKVVVPKSEE
ncbi:MAG: hypothetical protein E7031_05225 [Akkermansiaceae bacterium]|nr:hypothetical protein [Akkermansiaceae bacterium]